MRERDGRGMEEEEGKMVMLGLLTSHHRHHSPLLGVLLLLAGCLGVVTRAGRRRNVTGHQGWENHRTQDTGTQPSSRPAEGQPRTTCMTPPSAYLVVSISSRFVCMLLIVLRKGSVCCGVLLVMCRRYCGVVGNYISIH